MSTKESKRSARDKLAEERRRQAAADKRKRTITNSVIAVVVVAAIVAIFVLVQNERQAPDVGNNVALPALVTEQGGGMTFGDGPVTVDLWEDFQCPHCKDFEAVNGAMLGDKVDAGEITMVVHPVSFMDQNLQNDSSVLAANAFGCTAASGEEAGLAFHSKVFAEQPPEALQTPAWSNDDLIGWGTESGVDDPGWESCVNDGTYSDWVTQVEASMVDAGVSTTPTIIIDGKTFNGDPQSLDEVTAAIDAAGK